jgi:CRP-like cAMP-binding protein
MSGNNDNEQIRGKILYPEFHQFISEHYYPINQDLWNILELLVEKKNVKRGDIIIQKGDTVSHLIIAESGYYKTYYQDDNDEIYIKSFHSAKDFLSPANELTHLEESSVYVECLKEGVIYKLAWRELNNLSQKSELIKKLIQDLSKKQLMALSQKMKDLITLSSIERFEKLKNERPDLLENVKQKLIANYLGISPVALSRLIHTGKTSA